MKLVTRLLCSLTLCGASLAMAHAAEGTVVTSLKAESYSYVEVTRDGVRSWLVAPLTDVKPGNRVHYDEGFIVQSIFSQQLQRTFEMVMFVPALNVVADKK